MGFDGPDGNFYCFFVFSLIRCGYHSRTLPPTLDSREMFASATAALRTPPCLFPYAGARTDYTVKYAIKYTAAVKQLPASFAPISPFAVALLQLSTEPYCTVPSTNIAHLPNLRSADSTALRKQLLCRRKPGRGSSRYAYIV